MILLNENGKMTCWILKMKSSKRKIEILPSALSKFVLFFLATLLIVACGPVTPYPMPTIVSTRVPVDKQTPLIPVSQLTITPTQSPTSTPSPSIELQKLANIYDPKDPSLPELIVPSDGAMKLDPNWQIATIEYTYAWWGYSDQPGLGYEKIEKKNADYYWNKQKIDASKVQKFTNTISNLHSAGSLLTGTWHTDDYPTWQLDLTGADGNHVLIYSSSNENPGYGPWHVIYNGRIYVEYQGEIGLAIAQLFDRDQSEFTWKPWDGSDYHPARLAGFAATGWPNQLWYGFNGLLPIAGSFHYYIDPEKQELNGYVRGRYSIGGFGNMVVGEIDTLRSVTITIEKKQRQCKIAQVESQDSYSAEWMFSCGVVPGGEGQRYRYPIKINFGTDLGRDFLTTGELVGALQTLDDFWVIPPAEEIQKAIEAEPNFPALLRNSTLYVAKYTGKFDLDKDSSPVLSGQFIFVGEAIIDGAKVKYSVFTPFIVENQRFVRFGLSEPALKQFLLDVVRSPITRRVLAYNPDITVNMWYANKDNAAEPEMPNLWRSGGAGFSEIKVGVCGENPEIAYPTKDEPLRLFSFNSDALWHPWDGGVGNTVKFMLTGDQTSVNMIYLGWWGDMDQKELPPFWQILLPSQLHATGMPPFLQIDYSAAERILRIAPPYNSTDDQFAMYEKSLALLPLPFETRLLNSARDTKLYNYTENDIDIIVRDDGTLAINACTK